MMMMAVQGLAFEQMEEAHNKDAKYGGSVNKI